MKEKKTAMFLLAIVLIALSSIIYVRTIQPKMDDDKKIVVGMKDDENKMQDAAQEDDLVLSERDALTLAMEQIDINQYKIELLKHILEIEEGRYYIFDIINKSGPSFGMELAINIRSGDMYAYNPNKKELLPMSQFPIETPIAQEQDWNGLFLDEINPTDAVALELRQGDAKSFEFDLLRLGEEKQIIFQGVARINGAMASFEDENGYRLLFVMKDKTVKIKEAGIRPFGDKEITIEGSYRAKESATE